TKQMLAGGMHALGIERLEMRRNKTGQQRGPDRRIDNAVTVTAAERGETGMEIVRHHPRPLYADVSRQQGVATKNPGFIGAYTGRIEMHHLATGMHTGIGTPGAM